LDRRVLKGACSGEASTKRQSLRRMTFGKGYSVNKEGKMKDQEQHRPGSVCGQRGFKTVAKRQGRLTGRGRGTCEKKNLWNRQGEKRTWGARPSRFLLSWTNFGKKEVKQKKNSKKRERGWKLTRKMTGTNIKRTKTLGPG